MRFLKRFYFTWQHDRKLTENIVRQHWMEGCERCKVIFQHSRDWRMVEAVARGYLKTHVIWMCPTGRGRPKQFRSVMDVPDTLRCSCGQTHDVSMDDIDIGFTIT